MEGGAAAGKNAERHSTPVRALALLPNEPKAVERAEKAPEDEKPEVRESAATALGQMGSKTSAPKLKKLLTDKERRAVLAAAHSLLRLRDNVGYEVYYAILTGTRKSGEGLLDQQVQMLKDPKKLEEFGFEEGIGFVPFAAMGYSAIKAIAKDDASPVRAAGAKVLSKDPDPASGQALVRAATDKSWVVRVAALNAIAERGEPSLLSADE